MTRSNFEGATLMRDCLRQLNEHILDASREAAKLYLDTYEKTLEAIASFHDEAASQTDVEMLATATKAQATLIRTVAERQVATCRELLDAHEVSGSPPPWPPMRD
jgi:hypothetical protein